MKKIYSVPSEAVLAVLRSLFEAERIPYFVQNDTFGSILPGPQIENYNTKSIFVPDEFEENAREIVLHFEAATNEPESEITHSDRFRMIFETALFSWFVPRKR